MASLSPAKNNIVVVGAGAAGLMAAIGAARTLRQKSPLEIVLLDARPQIGAKILMSGGTRCNVTNREVVPADFQGGARHFIKHALEAFPPEQTRKFFNEIGVELVLEPTGKYFPVTHSAQTVLSALVKEAERTGVVLKTGVRITEIKKMGDLFHLRNSDGSFHTSARKVILTTGGLSYPSTGSDGTGYAIARNLGHTIVDTFPALTPLLTNDSDWSALSGVSLEAKLSFFKNGKKEAESLGSFLFTHFGFSGPAALDISRHFAAAKPEENPKIVANFIPQESEAALEKIKEFPLPKRFMETFTKKIGTGKKKTLVHMLLNYPLEITGVFGYKKAEVTAGGVDLREIKVQTMESKLTSGLYFAGEILDVDGRIGGFNFQWAWSTGAVAGRSAAQSLS